MRYLILFFLFLLSNNVLSAQPSCTNQGILNGYQPTTGVNAMANCNSTGGTVINYSTFNCNVGGQWVQCLRFSCGTGCSCPSGQKKIVVNGVADCVPEDPEDEEPNCEAGQAMVNGQCMVCLFGESNGQCNQNDPPDTCESGQTLQGYVNGQPVCTGQGSCSSGQSWGTVNGVEGCYGSPSCESGSIYGSINGVSGCWPELTCDALGQCGGSSSSSGSGDSGGNSSTGSGGGGDEGGSGDNGGGGNNGTNPGYVNPPGFDDCPVGMYLGADRVCRTPNNDPECPLPNYHYILVNYSTGAGICVPDTQQGSSSSQASSAPSSSNNSANGNNSSSDNHSSAPSESGNGQGDEDIGKGTAAASNCENGEPQCDGDPVQCAILFQLWINNCAGFNEVDLPNPSSDNEAIRDNFDELMSSAEAAINQDGVLDVMTPGNAFSDGLDLSGLDGAANSGVGGSCPADRSITLGAGTFSISYQFFCDFASQVSGLVILIFSYIGAMIVYKSLQW